MNNFELCVKASTWLKESHRLFDYEASDKIIKKLKISTSGILYRRLNDVTFYPELEIIEGGMIRVSNHNNEFTLHPVLDEPIGIPLRYVYENANEGFLLRQGDYFKLGKSLFKVVKISMQGEIEASEKTIEEPTVCENSCRICFCSSETILNPLISLCKCIGTMKLIHLKCLQHWLIAKSFKKVNTFCVSYFWTSTECDICKEALPMSFTYKSVSYRLIVLPNPGSPYVVLEDFRRDQYTLQLHVLFPMVAPFLIGRNSDCDLRLSDITVSRSHAKIQLKDGFYLKDNNSKFGTIVMTNKPIHLKIGEELPLQINRTLLKFTLRKQSKHCFFCCITKNQKNPPPQPKKSPNSHLEAEEFTFLQP